MRDARLRRVDEHASVDPAEACLALEEEREIFPIGFRIDREEARKTVFVEELRIEGERRSDAA